MEINKQVKRSLDVQDPKGRSPDELLRFSYTSFSEGRMNESAILGYLALKGTEKEANKQLGFRAKVHLHLSDIMGQFGYRSMETIHAKAARRSLTAAIETGVTTDLNPGLVHAKLGTVAMYTGEYSIAEYYFQRALTDFEPETKSHSPHIISVLIELANLSIARVDRFRTINKPALEELNRSMEFITRAESLLDNDLTEYSFQESILEFQARCLLKLSARLPPQEKTKAIQLLKQAERNLTLSLSQRSKKPRCRSNDRLKAMNDLVTVYRRTDRYLEATDLTGKMLEETGQRQRGDMDLPISMALVAEKMENRTSVRTACRIAIHNDEFRISSLSSTSSEAASLSFRDHIRSRVMMCLSVLSRSAGCEAESARLLLDMVLLIKGIVTESESAFWKKLYHPSSDEFSKAREHLLWLRNQLSMQVTKGQYSGLWRLINEIEKGQTFLSVEPEWRLFNANDNVEQKQRLEGYANSLLAGQSPWSALEKHKPIANDQSISSDDLLRQLVPGFVLVEFIKIDNYSIEQEIFLDSANYWALILHADGRCKAVDVGEAAKIEADISFNLSRLHSCDRLISDGQIESMKALYTSAWSRLEPELENIEGVIISPDGALALIPFSALVDSQDRFLIERLTILITNTGRDLIADQKTEELKEGYSVVVSDPDFGDPSADQIDSALTPLGIPPLERLNYTQKEGKIVQEALGPAVEYLSQDKATEGAIRKYRRPRVLHFATHGLFCGMPPDPPKNVLSKEDKAALNSSYVKHIQTLSRSGIALSGFNTSGKGDFDGMLTAFDVSGMDLYGTELVVMSACDTGRGEVYLGEGVMGLRRAFRIAGAKHILMSLWPLSDRDAVMQMRAFYKAYTGGKNPVQALRSMQIARIRRLRETLGEAPPLLWAAFAIEGFNAPLSQFVS